jgi:hypothetical protein
MVSIILLIKQLIMYIHTLIDEILRLKSIRKKSYLKVVGITKKKENVSKKTFKSKKSNYSSKLKTKPQSVSKCFFSRRT